MKKNYLLLVLIVLLLVGCVTQRRRIKGSVTFESTITAPDTSVVPLFNAAVLYVLAREYENSRDTLRSMGEYVEERLIELYPEKAYHGMMSKVAEQTMDRLQTMYNAPQYRANAIDGLTLSSLNESYFNSVADSAEVEFMQMTEAEASAYWSLNALADSEAKFRLADFDSITVFDSEWGLNAILMGDNTPYIIDENWAISFVCMGVASTTIYRIMQSKARAEYVARHFFKSNTNYGKRGDAYKHIFVNLLLRRYTTAKIAWLVMDVYWEQMGENKPCDRIMDYHNNLLGREYHYEKFQQSASDWRYWAYTVRDFINDTTLNAEFMNWDLNTPTFIVTQEEQKSNPYKYIYWNKNNDLIDDIKE